MNKKTPVWYMAGRIEKDRYRFGLVAHTMDMFEFPATLPLIDAPVKYGLSFGHGDTTISFAYSGPYTIGDDHGCAHNTVRGSTTHGSGPTCAERRHDRHINQLRARGIFHRAMSGIKQADAMFAWIKDEECFGTLVEIGYAKSLGIPIYLAHHPDVDPNGELWFAFEAADYIRCSTEPDIEARRAIAHFATLSTLR